MIHKESYTTLKITTFTVANIYTVCMHPLNEHFSHDLGFWNIKALNHRKSGLLLEETLCLIPSLSTYGAEKM